MAAPTVLSVYPANEDTGIPVGETIKIYFSKGVDAQTVQDSVVLFGNDRDMFSGPDSQLWINSETGANPHFLTSPGLKGVVATKVTLYYYDLNTNELIDSDTLVDEQADETSLEIGHVAYVNVDPKVASQLGPNTVYTLHVIGDPDSVNAGISGRTIYDVVAGGGNTGNGSLQTVGSFLGATAETVHVKITTSGDIGVAKYKWWYAGAGEGSAILGKVTSPRFRTVEDGLKIKFSGSGFAVGDTWTFKVYPIERLEETTILTFTTNDGSYSAAPASPSTPASSTPPTSSLPATVDDVFEVLEMDPAIASYNVDRNRRIITITFSEDVDAATITNDSVVLWAYPVSGNYDGQSAPRKLQKQLSLVNNILTITY